MVCAGYCAYGSATELVITYGHGVERFTLDPSIGEFILTGEKLTIPEVCKTIYSINEGNYLTWDTNMQKAIDGFRLNKPPYTARYVGSMVADVHRTLLYGGIYLYPADAAKVIIISSLPLTFCHLHSPILCREMESCEYSMRPFQWHGSLKMQEVQPLLAGLKVAFIEFLI